MFDPAQNEKGNHEKRQGKHLALDKKDALMKKESLVDVGRGAIYIYIYVYISS